MKKTFALALLLCSLAAAAAPKGNASDWIRAGERAYQSGKYVEAADALKKAYSLDPHPRLLYNIARAYDQAVDIESALQYYQLYLSANEGTDPMLLRRAALSIDRLRSAQAKNQVQAKDQEVERKRLAAEAAAARQRADEEAEGKRVASARQAELEQQIAESTVKRNRTLAYVSAGVGVAGLTTAIVMGVNALRSSQSFKESMTLEDKTKYRTAARTQAIVADVGLVLAAAGAITAVVLYPKGTGADPQKVRAMVVPTGNGVGMHVEF